MKSSVFIVTFLTLIVVAQASIFNDRWKQDWEEHKYLAPYILSGVGILLGIIVCFLGYRLFRPVLFLAGFLVGAGVCFFVLWYYTSTGLIVLIFAPLLTGIALGVILVFAISAGIFLLGATLGFLLFTMLVSVRDGGIVHSEIFNWVGMGVCSIVGGVIALLLQKPLIIMATSVGGAYAVIACIDRYVNGNFSRIIEQLIGNRHIVAAYPTYIELGACLVLSLLGIIVQYKVTAKGYYHSQKQAHHDEGYFAMNE